MIWVDQTTETIAHFIGSFELKVDALRMRDAYEDFAALQRKLALDPLLESEGPVVDAELEPDPASQRPLGNPDTAPAFAMAQSGPAPTIQPQEPLAADRGALAAPPAPPSSGPFAHLGKAGIPSGPLAVPGSVVAVNVQTISLHDNDQLGQGTFRDLALHAEQAEDIAALAHSLHGPGWDGMVLLPGLDAAGTLAARMSEFEAATVPGATQWTDHSAGANGMILNGVEVETLPLWTDLLPAYHARDDTTGDEPAPVAETDVPGWALPEGYVPNAQQPEGHSLVTGGNIALNQAALVVSWVDAPTIAVGGKWIALDLISQVAAVSDYDTGGARTGSTSIYHSVEIAQSSNEAAWHGAGGHAGQPVSVSLGVIEGDLIISNYIEQIIELFDNDHFGMAITGANTSYILGGNTAYNATSLFEGGFGYDLILVAGNYIATNVIHQTLVLLDDDMIYGSGGTQVASAGLPSVAENAGVDDAGWSPASDNLLVNEARLTTVGTDQAAELSDELSGLLAELDAGNDALIERLASDPHLAGVEHARVLVVKGDLVQSNTIDQSILVSDRDDIRIDGAAPGDLDLVAGSNVLVNAAEIVRAGVDSVVMAGQEPYSDLLLHQASLIEGDAAGGDGGGTHCADDELASEAVAFLADEASGQVADSVDSGATGGHSTAACDANDLMHGVLA